MMNALKSRKFWFFCASFLSGVGLAAIGQFSLEIGAFLISLPSAYGMINVRQKNVMSQALKDMNPRATE